VAVEETWIGIVPVGYADGFRRDMTGTEVLVGTDRAEVVGTVSMDALAVRLAAPVETGAPVTLVGDGITLEAHARVAETIAYELACGIRTSGERSTREVVG
jgi:alanine racemase